MTHFFTYLSKSKFFYLCFFLATSLTFSQAQTSPELVKILEKSKNLRPILKNAEAWEIQIIYTQIDRDAANRPEFTTFYLNHNPSAYFYPASTVKLPAVLLALEKINKNVNNRDGFSKHSPLLIDSAFPGHEAVQGDTTAENGHATVAHYAKKILLVSDNDAYNRLYDFLGIDYFNYYLHRKGYLNTRIAHRLSVPYSSEENKITPRVRFFSDSKNRIEDSTLVFTQSAQESSKNYVNAFPILRGKGYYKADKLINEPFDFASKNVFLLADQQRMLTAILFPNAVPEGAKFNLSPDDYQFVRRYMSQLPSEQPYPTYAPQEYYDSYVKFLLFGDKKEKMPSNIRIFNKVGDAYGYLIDNAYVVDFENKVEFMLSAVIHCNSDGIFNDDKYDYENVGFPFMGELGRTIYQHELKRKKTYLPDLSEFIIDYSSK
ncbi:MAG: serine hydrolase [Spirosomataceae bacterium]